jgi:hypothetical protein
MRMPYSDNPMAKCCLREWRPAFAIESADNGVSFMPLLPYRTQTLETLEASCDEEKLTVSQATGGTYGNASEGLEVTDSLPMPKLIGVFNARENITLGALSVRDRPFHSANPKTAGVPTV